MKPLATLLAFCWCTGLGLADEKPRLVILIVFDQMRGDYIQKWQPFFGKEGFARLQKEGAWFVNCHYPYAVTTTGAGHTSMSSGTCPDVHGIINNTWYDAKRGAVVNCSEDVRWTRIPPLPKKEVEKKADTAAEEPKAYGTPERALAPTFGDALKIATDGKAKVLGLSFKDRSAVLPTGTKADAAYWLDNEDGMFVTSSFFRDAVHPWVSEFNKARGAERWFNKPWTQFLPDFDYAKLLGPDDAPGEGKGSKQGTTFPHAMDGGDKKISKAYYEAVYNSPFGNDLLLEFVKTAIVSEQLGQRAVPDFLSVSFSSNDAVGHVWGPDSHEVFDTTLRSDAMLADFLKFLDEKVGKGKYLLCLCADHGICPIPEVSAAKGMDAHRFHTKRMMAEAELHLRKKFAPTEDIFAKTRWIENTTVPWVYLNHKLIESKKLDVEKVANELADFLNLQPGMMRTFTRNQLASEPDRYDNYGKMMKRSYHPERCGDVGMLLRPYWLFGDEKYPTGTTHGTPYPYDTHVPLLVYGPNVKAGIREERVTPQTIASILATALGINPPAKAEFPTPEGLFAK